MSLILKSFLSGGIVAAILVGIGFLTGNVLVFSIIAAACFAYITCIALRNNIVSSLIDAAFALSIILFVKIFEKIFPIGLDGVLCLVAFQIPVLVLYAILVLTLCLLAFALGLAIAVFVFPYALIKRIFNIREED